MATITGTRNVVLHGASAGVANTLPAGPVAGGWIAEERTPALVAVASGNSDGAAVPDLRFKASEEKASAMRRAAAAPRRWPNGERTGRREEGKKDGRPRKSGAV